MEGRTAYPSDCFVTLCRTSRMVERWPNWLNTAVISDSLHASGSPLTKIFGCWVLPEAPSLLVLGAMAPNAAVMSSGRTLLSATPDGWRLS